MFETNLKNEVMGTVNQMPNTSSNAQPLRESVKKAMRNYLTQLNGQDINDLYELFLSEVEAPLLEEVMTYTRGNQTRASNLLGVNRGTLRKKLKKYGMN
ncbi:MULTISPECIES: DNA-binding transcriptional regulator Fis [Corallincola]|uniref:Putative Fis-like DNA-binding protein n=3 Tax=Corallincola TaxID=1775176 RepID=A0A368N3F0_9GAMM|nr:MULTISPECIES: DNA-binding transcriptional regulator Fis [Corallincola]RCU43799.1 DNA-binding transcriptional regulator Fis [Corallincola holothuriorum]TAA46914.1 DNA-binding transcriptional regulator Fis [Corallincola spongiicola]TCI04562.1 DNA-binding transcriptional regulator Fis [Corallincola luteus]